MIIPSFESFQIPPEKNYHFNQTLCCTSYTAIHYSSTNRKYYLRQAKDHSSSHFLISTFFGEPRTWQKKDEKNLGTSTTFYFELRHNLKILSIQLILNASSIVLWLGSSMIASWGRGKNIHPQVHWVCVCLLGSLQMEIESYAKIPRHLFPL